MNSEIEALFKREIGDLWEGCEVGIIELGHALDLRKRAQTTVGEVRHKTPVLGSDADRAVSEAYGKFHDSLKALLDTVSRTVRSN
jgi:hypothetical protein